MITRQLQGAIQDEIRVALAAIAKKYNLATPSIDLRRYSDGSAVRLMKLDMFVSNPDREAAAKEMVAQFSTNVDANLAAVLKQMGITNLTNRRGETITAYKPSRPKYPFVYRGPQGGLWKASRSDIMGKFAA